MPLRDYILVDDNFDWANLLGPWLWLLPRELTVWFANRFGDVFFVFKDGSINLLRLDSGKLLRLAESRIQFEEVIDEGDNSTEWLLIPLVDHLVRVGKTLGVGECYAFLKPPILGGTYDDDNIVVLNLVDYLPALGRVHEQIKDLPDGTEVVIR